METYLQCERNYVKTAEKLFIHRNYLLYRIERISELTGLDLDSPDIRLHILMSYRIERLSKMS
ncbi:helix-turn-helix domain-containing protein [Dehalobacter sp. 4CP]|uniref:PucR family transcriptional regulator n=1 Tax=Dehalobacter sp. CP TaxID=2594474 RepID=UPI0039E88FD8